MKNVFRLVALALVCVMLCVALSGCDKTIKEIQDFASNNSRYGVILDDGSLRYNGMTYLPLPEGEYHINREGEIESIQIYGESVPILLRNTISGDFASLYNTYNTDNYNKRFIELPCKDSAKYYCVADVYDEVVAEIEGGIEYPVYRYETVTNRDFLVFRYFTEDQITALREILSTVEPVILEGEAYYSEAVPCCAQSKSGYFYKVVFKLCRQKNKLYLSKESESGTLTYHVPEEYVSLLEPILDKANLK